MYTWYCWESLREKNHLEEPGLDEEIILKWIIKQCFGGMRWIEVAQGRDRGWELVKARNS